MLCECGRLMSLERRDSDYIVWKCPSEHCGSEQSEKITKHRLVGSELFPVWLTQGQAHEIDYITDYITTTRKLMMKYGFDTLDCEIVGVVTAGGYRADFANTGVYLLYESCQSIRQAIELGKSVEEIRSEQVTPFFTSQVVGQYLHMIAYDLG